MRALTPTGVNGAPAAALAALGAGLLTVMVRRRARDEAYPGRAAVQFTPPAGATPGEAGTLLDERAGGAGGGGW